MLKKRFFLSISSFGAFSPILIYFLGGIIMLSPHRADAERIFFAGYKSGFYIRSEEEGGMELRLGGTYQTDYRYYAEPQRADNRFDVRRARLRFRGQLTRYFRFGMQYEFQGNETNNLVDAYGEAVLMHTDLRFGQFKEPFGLEWQSLDKAQFFAERSMGYHLGPKRDIGMMLHGALFQEGIVYGAGLFNGDGDDGSISGAKEDSPELALRVVLAPFKRSSWTWLNGLQLGGAATYARIDVLNLDVNVKSTGMPGTERSIYRLTHNTKFGVIQDVKSRRRLGMEAAWAVGPFLFCGEYTQMVFSDLVAAGDNPSDATVSAWYAGVVWHLTGEKSVLSAGRIAPLYPHRFFNPEEGTWGALSLAARLEHFSGDESWITSDAYVSAAEADAFSLALNWTLFPMARVVLDFTRTRLSDPIRVRVLPDGSVDYIDKENVVTCRFNLDF